MALQWPEDDPDELKGQRRKAQLGEDEFRRSFGVSKASYPNVQGIGSRGWLTPAGILAVPSAQGLFSRRFWLTLMGFIAAAIAALIGLAAVFPSFLPWL